MASRDGERAAGDALRRFARAHRVASGLSLLVNDAGEGAVLRDHLQVILDELSVGIASLQDRNEELEREGMTTHAAPAVDVAAIAPALEQLPAFVWTTDTLLRLTTFLGSQVPTEDARMPALGDPVEDVFSDERVTEAHRRALGGTPAEVECARPSGILWCTIQPLRDASGRIVGCIGISRDVTRTRIAQGALEHALEAERETSAELHRMNRLKDLLLTTVSHDVLNGLTVVIGFSGMLEEMPELDPARTRKMLHSIGQRGRRLERTLRDLLHLDKLDRQIVQPDWADADVTEIIRRVVAGFEEPGHPIMCEPGPTLAKVSATELERIVENLLDDAIKHTPAGTPIWIRTEPAEGGGIVLIVEDAGPGIPDAAKPAIFDPFARGSDSAEGHGIGLSIVARFAELHGGRAWVEDRPGGGTSFHVSLPGPREEAPDLRDA